VGVLGKDWVALQIQEQALKEVGEIENPESAAFEHLEFIVQAFDEAAGEAVHKEVGDFIEGMNQGFQKRLKPGERLLTDEKDPGVEFRLGWGFGKRALKNRP
jgi:hypothetical protein